MGGRQVKFINKNNINTNYTKQVNSAGGGVNNVVLPVKDMIQVKQ